MKALRVFWDEAQTKNSAIWDASVNGGFSFADAPDTGVSMCVIYEGEPGTVRAELEAAAQLAWDRREEGVVDYPSIDEVLSAKPTSDQGPILLVEPADNIGGGGPGDCTGVLRGLLRHGVTNALLALMDHQAVAALQDVEIGATTTLSLGGKGSRLDEGPVELEVTLRSRSDGNYQLEDKNSHMASMGGVNVRMGPSAVVEAQGITILLTSVKTPPFDLGQYRSQGIEPTDYAFIGVKAAVAHRRAYDKIMGASYFVDTMGPCRSNLNAFPWQHIRRPIFPLDQITEPEFQIL
jgi:microcystin degradation protein MlrC